MAYKVYFLTLGCKVNSYESAAIAKILSSKGFEETQDPSSCDVYVVNTCAVTAEADRKSRQMIRKARRVAPSAVVVAMGCHTEMCKDENGADITVGTSDRPALVPLLLEKLHLREQSETEEGAYDAGTRFFEYGAVLLQEGTRAVVKIEDGCNNFCTYCIIPYSRGRVRSRSREAVLEEIRDLAGKGYCEFVITGIHLCSYERELGHDSTALGELLNDVAKIEGVRRIRLGSLEPYSMSDKLISMLKENGKICPHFHLSLQSGSDTVLKRMNRKYDTALFREVVRKLRNAFPTASFTTDMICGFPGETEEEHKASCAFAEEIGFTHIHVFPFSPREGTKAFTMEDQITPDVKNRRTAELRAISDEMESARAKDFTGHTVEVLVEKVPEPGCFEGYCREYIRVLGTCNSGDLVPGEILYCKVNVTDGFTLRGEGFRELTP
ncbi:MAG: tRNA (N(6)-L-threonylcarbamoyladenosine(37)-C(2))-methylthiotransferase MtaB [Clostridiales bacterium]|nr:tRNA (N(6)-L-threonylcarbamoyladenosine(37)-C(2))-methylthiotransferase MtaB [Clostridiales bacterium]